MIDNGFDRDGRIVDLLRQMESFADYYAKITAGAETDHSLKPAFDSLARLNVSVLNPLLLSLYEDFEAGAFGLEDFIEMVQLLESYVFRRAICDAPTNSLNKFFPSVIAKLNKVQDEGGNYREAFESYFLLEEGTARRFPTDAEFVQALETRDVYHFRRSFYMLSCLENQHHKKDPLPIEPGTYTIEHIMPQNALEHDEWRAVLGPDCEEGFEVLVHSLGNLTLTAYNSELSDGTFEQKKERVIGGYDKEYSVISKAMHDADTWDAEAITARGRELAMTAKARWPFVTVSAEIASKYDAKLEKTLQQRTRTVFKTVFDAGLILAGSKLVPVSDSCGIMATVTDTGALELSNGETFNSPSLAAIRVVSLSGGGGHRNGWRFWRLGTDGPVIDELRSEYLLQAGESVTSDNKRFRAVFWSGFYEYCAEQQGFCDAFGDVSNRAQCKDHWVSFGLSTGKYHLDTLLLAIEGYVAVDVWFRDINAYKVVYLLKDDIELSLDCFGLELHWDDLVEDKKTRAIVVRRKADFDSEDWQDLYAWLVDWMWKLRAVMQEHGE